MDGEVWSAVSEAQAVPTGFTPVSLAAVVDAVRAAREVGQDPVNAARETAWSMHPALSAALIGDGVDYVLARI